MGLYLPFVLDIVLVHFEDLKRLNYNFGVSLLCKLISGTRKIFRNGKKTAEAS